MALDTRGMTSNLEIEGARRAEGSQQAGGLSMDRRLTKPGEDPLDLAPRAHLEDRVAIPVEVRGQGAALGLPGGRARHPLPPDAPRC